MKYFILMILFGLNASAAMQTEDKHRGGGNSVQNKLIESYILPLESLSGYHESTEWVLQKLRYEFPNLEVIIDQKLTRLTWYLVPVALEKLSLQQNGIPFASHQVAIQNKMSHEIFIDKNLFFKLEVNERGRLLLHEILMSLLPTNYLSDADHARVRKLVYNLDLSKPVSSWEPGLQEFFLDHTDDIKQNLRLSFSREEIRIYKQIYTSWNSNLKSACQNLAPYLAGEHYRDAIAINILNTSENFMNSEVCKYGDWACHALPYLSWETRETWLPSFECSSKTK